MESKALKIPGRKRVNGTVPIDSTIGNDTFFVVTWTIQKPEIVLQDPKGKKYKTSDFKEDKLNIRSARLQIPGIAEVRIFFIFSMFYQPILRKKMKITSYMGVGKYYKSSQIVCFFFLIFRQVLGLTAF